MNYFFIFGIVPSNLDFLGIFAEFSNIVAEINT